MKDTFRDIKDIPTLVKQRANDARLNLDKAGKLDKTGKLGKDLKQFQKKFDKTFHTPKKDNK